MFRDNSLIPAEAIKLAALGFLAEAPRRYGDLAVEIRHFISFAIGPSLDVMGNSLELLRYGGLVEASDGKGMSDNALLSLTEAGKTALHTLLTARLRSPSNDSSRLALLLKLRFLDCLPQGERQAQSTVIAQALETEVSRLEELRRHHESAPGAFRGWLDRDIDGLRAQLEALSAP